MMARPARQGAPSGRLPRFPLPPQAGSRAPADDDQPVGGGWYDKKLDRKVRRLNRAHDGKITVSQFVGDFVSALFEAIGHALSGM